MRWLELKIPPPLVGLLTGALMWAAARWLPELTFAGMLPGRKVAAAGIALAGIALDLVALAGFLRARTTINPLKPANSSALVTSGIYRHTRNPMYLGLLVILLGWTVYLGNLLSLLFLPAFVLYMNRFQIEPEERALAAVFGPAYASYRSRTRRWL